YRNALLLILTLLIRCSHKNTESAVGNGTADQTGNFRSNRPIIDSGNVFKTAYRFEAADIKRAGGTDIDGITDTPGGVSRTGCLMHFTTADQLGGQVIEVEATAGATAWHLATVGGDHVEVWTEAAYRNRVTFTSVTVN